MTRTRKSARKAGTEFETQVANFLKRKLDDTRIERRAKNGRFDRGDIAGVQTVLGQPVVIECKDVVRADLSGWVNEAEIECSNANATIAAVAHKRAGFGEARMGGTYVTMTLDNFAAMLGGIKEQEEN